MTQQTRPISWIKAARNEFEKFPEGARSICLAFEIGLAFRGDAFRVVYAVQLGDDIWVVHTFRKKSTRGTKTPKREIDTVKDRVTRLKEMLR